MSVFFMSYFLFGKHLNFPCCTQSVLSLMVKDKLPLVVMQIVDISAHSVEFPPFQYDSTPYGKEEINIDLIVYINVNTFK